MAIQIASSVDSAGAVRPAQKTPAQAQATVRAGSASKSDPNPEQVRQAVDDIRRAVEPAAHSLNFSIDQESGKTVVRVIDSATQELVRQIPSEEVMSISHALNRLAGVLLQEKA